MSYIHFTKEHLHDIAFSAGKEIILTSHANAYCSTSLSGCNTRKYHGLLIAPQPQLNGNRYVLLSALDETLVHGDKKIQLATHRYPNVYHPQGYRYMEEFTFEKNPRWIIKTDGFTLVKELLIARDEARVLIRYTLTEAKSRAELWFTPFLAFRDINTITKANMNVVKKTAGVANGIKLKLYTGFTDLYMQFSRKASFIQAPDWYYNIEYLCEMERGYEYNEDLYSPGYFKLPLKKGESVIFSAGLSEIAPRTLSGFFTREERKLPSLHNFKDCLENAASQFIVSTDKGIEINAGYHWFGRWGRDTFISLPGLTLSTDMPDVFNAVVSTMEKQLKGGLFPNMGKGNNSAFNTADASLWYFWALQQYATYIANPAKVWKDHGNKMKSILNAYRKGTLHHIHMENNGLIYAGEQGIYVTWMDALVEGKPVTPRTGLAVELSALWYNAVCFSLEAAKKAGDKKFVEEWLPLAQKIKDSFNTTFWNDEKGYLADCIYEGVYDWALRPNQVLAVSLPYSPLEYGKQKAIVDIVKNKLLTPRGLRTLSPDDSAYKGRYLGNSKARDTAYHQGAVWPWTMGHFTEAYLKVYGEKGKEFLQPFYENFAPAISEYGLCTISELYDGDMPQKPRGAIAQAWSVAELLRMRELITGYSHAPEELKKIKITEAV